MPVNRNPGAFSNALTNIFMQDLIGYDEIIENSMRSVIYETLKKIEKSGLPGKHYFVITFATDFDKVDLSKKLREKYDEEMTIVVQYQYRDLKVEHDYFEISLSFGGNYEKLTVPYKAITSFSDPSMNFALKFSMNYGDDDDLITEETSKPANKEPEIDLSSKVISLDAFRNKKK